MSRYIQDGLRVMRHKFAASAGDTTFEQSFSNIAHAYLRERAASLLDYEQGFQLIERDEDGKRAVGIISFRVGDSQMFVPLVFTNGNLKGSELLYLKNHDLFVPCTEGWLNDLLKRRPALLGDPVKKDYFRNSVGSPAIEELGRPRRKYASAYDRESMAVLSHAVTRPDYWASRLHDVVKLPHVIKTSGVRPLGRLLASAAIYPQFAHALRTHADGDVLEMAKTAAAAAAWPRRSVLSSGHSTHSGSVLTPAVKTAATIPLRIYRYSVTERFEVPQELSNEQLETLKQDGQVIVDARPDDAISKVVEQDGTQGLSSPTESGIYDVLTANGEYVRCFVGIGPVADTDVPAIVVPVDEPEAYKIVPQLNAVLCTRAKDANFDAWQKSLPTATTLKKDEAYMLVGPHGQSSLPFHVSGNVLDNAGELSAAVNMAYARFGAADRVYPRGAAQNLAYLVPNESVSEIVIGGAVGKIRKMSNKMYVPKDYKLVRLKGGESLWLPCCVGDKWRPPSPISLGTINDAIRKITQKTASVTVQKRASGDVRINDAVVPSRDAIWTLMSEYGLRQKTAETWLACDDYTPVTYAIKRAYGAMPGFPQDPRDSGGNDMLGFSGMTQSPQSQTVPIPVTREEPTPAPYTPQEMEIIQNAMQTGQRELFDTSVISRLMRESRDDTMIDGAIPALVKAVDSLGRLLFHFYWHSDTFIDRYGKTEMPELEDGLRNSFEDLGDVILFLRQKAIRPYPEEDVVSLSLDAAASL